MDALRRCDALSALVVCQQQVYRVSFSNPRNGRFRGVTVVKKGGGNDGAAPRGFGRSARLPPDGCHLEKERAAEAFGLAANDCRGMICKPDPQCPFVAINVDYCLR